MKLDKVMKVQIQLTSQLNFAKHLRKFQYQLFSNNSKKMKRK